MEWIVIFDMDNSRFLAHNVSKPMPPRHHKACLGTFKGPNARTGAEKAARNMTETYWAEPYPRINSPISKFLLIMARAGLISVKEDED